MVFVGVGSFVRVVDFVGAGCFVALNGFVSIAGLIRVIRVFKRVGSFVAGGDFVCITGFIRNCSFVGIAAFICATCLVVLATLAKIIGFTYSVFHGTFFGVVFGVSLITLIYHVFSCCADIGDSFACFINVMGDACAWCCRIFSISFFIDDDR